MKIEAVSLAGDFVCLEPLKIDQLDELCAIGFDPEIWRWTTHSVQNREEMRLYIATALEEKVRKVALPFVIVDQSSGAVVGSTRFGNIDVKNRRAEIGWTWIHPRWQRTALNSEAKLLLLTHAFETWCCIRVELKTDALNTKSRAAILRIGAQQEGILRQHMITDSGRFRDSVYFSILDAEWPNVKENLRAKLRQFA